MRFGSSGRESIMSSYSMMPFLLNPVKEIDEPQQEMTQSTKLGESDFSSWQTPMNKKDYEKDLQKIM